MCSRYDPAVFRWCLEQGADVHLTVNANQQTLYRQIGCQFQGKRRIPFTATDHEKKQGWDIVWELPAKEEPEHIKANWPGSAWIVEVITDTVTRSNGKRSIRRHLGGLNKRTSRWVEQAHLSVRHQPADQPRCPAVAHPTALEHGERMALGPRRTARWSIVTPTEPTFPCLRSWAPS